MSIKDFEFPSPLDKIMDRKRAMGLQLANHLEKSMAARDPIVVGTAYMVLAANFLSRLSTSEADLQEGARTWNNDVKALALEFYQRDQQAKAARAGPNGAN